MYVLFTETKTNTDQILRLQLKKNKAIKCKKTYV